MKRYIQEFRMRTVFHIILLSIILFPSCKKWDTVSFQTPYPQPTAITITTQWAAPTQSDNRWERKTDTLNLTSYSKVEISFNVDFSQENSTSREYYFMGEFLEYDSTFIYLHGYQSENRAGYWLELAPILWQIPDQVVLKMSFVTAPDTLTFYNLQIVGYKN